MASFPEWFEELYLGHQVRARGVEAVSEVEIIEFASKYDPFDWHTDPEAAKQSLFGGLVASGLHFFALVNPIRIRAHGPLRQVAGIGIDDARWRKPLRPGDILSIAGECIEHEPGSRRDAGRVAYQYTVLNQNSEEVLRYTLRFLVARKPV